MIPGLDGLRAIAILLVIALHNEYLPVGWIGVQLFFVLSGFLITRILINMKDQISGGREYFSKFYGRRFLRIFPVYYFYLALMAIICYILFSLSYRPNKMLLFFEQVPFALTYTFNLFTASSFFENTYFLTHFWSLSLEEQFYLFWPTLIFFIPRRHWQKLFLLAIFLGPFFRLTFSLLAPALRLEMLNANIPNALYSLPFSHIDAFGFGAFICCFKIPKPKQQLLALSILIPLVGILGEYHATGDLHAAVLSLGYPLALANNLKYIWGYTLLNYFFMLLIYCVVYEKLFVNALEIKAVRYIGKISYGLYIFHYAMIWFVRRGLEFLPYSGNVQFPVLILSFLLTLLISSLSYKWLEAPLLGMKDRFFRVDKESSNSDNKFVVNTSLADKNPDLEGRQDS